MKNSEAEKILTMGEIFDVFFSQANTQTQMKKEFSPQGMKAYEKGFFHQIPTSSTEPGKIPSTPMILAEMDDDNGYIEYEVSATGPVKPLTRDQFLQKYFGHELGFSWAHLSKDEHPPLPLFMVGSMVGDSAYKIFEFKNQEEACRFVETTAKGFKNLAANVAKDNPKVLAPLSRLSEFQTVRGIRVLLHRMFEEPVSPERFSAYYNIWWAHRNLVFAAATPVHVILSKDRERFLNGSLENDKEYEEGLALLKIFLRCSNRLRPKTLREATIQDFDRWNWSLSQTTPIIALGRRVFSIFPISIEGNELTKVYISQISVVRKGILGALRSDSPPKAVYAKYWNEKKSAWMGDLLARNSKLPYARDRLQILLEAFNNGPPTAYINAHYGPEIAASALFFKNDFLGPLNQDEDFRMDEWKTIFGNTLRNKYGFSGLPFVSTKIPEYAQKTGLPGIFWAIFRMDVDCDQSTKEYIWVWPNELGFCFLDAIDKDGQTIGNEFMRLLNVEREKALRVVFEEGNEAKKALMNKMDPFMARLQQNST